VSLSGESFELIETEALLDQNVFCGWVFLLMSSEIPCYVLLRRMSLRSNGGQCFLDYYCLIGALIDPSIEVV
jgi:hypothetical protein